MTANYTEPSALALISVSDPVQKQTKKKEKNRLDFLFPGLVKPSRRSKYKPIWYTAIFDQKNSNSFLFLQQKVKIFLPRLLQRILYHMLIKCERQEKPTKNRHYAAK
jgi:hypothetical protein